MQNDPPIWRRLWCAETGLFLVVWLALMFCGRNMLLRDPGTYWHTVVGEQILDGGEVVREDSFSFTNGGKPWVAHCWAAEVGMAAVYRHVGWDGLLLVTVTLLAAVYTLLGSRLFRAGLHPLPALLLMAMVLVASSHQFHARPLIFTMVLLAVTFAILVDVESGRGRLRRLWWIVPLTIFWANVHGGVLAGLGSVGLVVGGWCAVKLFGSEGPIRQPRDLLAAGMVVLACCAVVLINPYGLDLPRTWWNTLTMPLPGLIQEHRPLDPTDPQGLATILLGAGYLFALAGVLPKRPRITWLLPLVWFVLACQRIRHAPLFAITAAIAAADLLPHTRWAEWLRGREMFAPPREDETHGARWPAAILPVLLIGAAIVLQAAHVSMPVIGRGWAGPDPSRFPVELVPELEQINAAAEPNEPIFNDLDFGGFVIFHAPRMRVFIDDRCALHGTELLNAYDDAWRNHPAKLDDWQREHGFRYALVRTGLNFDRHLKQSPEWTVVKRTAVGTLYRHSPEEEP
ncbi:MAG: hypothetical protein HQ567_10410 [Candidatus Nealsonbacteria bacterium]|nr:hypothetical protein [Candidatus Nealsonbacteria bacterium]